MKQLPNTSGTPKKYLALGLFFFFQSLLWAQEKEVDVSLNVDEGTTTEWYAQPWMWVVGGAIFILLVIALVRGKK